MRSYIAVDDAVHHFGGWRQCVEWARQRVEESGHTVWLYTGRGGEKEAELVAEVSVQGVLRVPRGRYDKLRHLRRLRHV
jgi:hypothetical protein